MNYQRMLLVQMVKMKCVKSFVKNMIQNDSIDEVLKVTGDIVKEAACQMKPKKGDVSESYTSDKILNAPDKVVLLIWGHLLVSDTLQFGYKEGTSTTQCSWLVMEVANHYIRDGTNPIMTLLDCSRALICVVFIFSSPDSWKGGYQP